MLIVKTQNAYNDNTKTYIDSEFMNIAYRLAIYCPSPCKYIKYKKNWTRILAFYSFRQVEELFYFMGFVFYINTKNSPHLPNHT